MFGLVNLSSCGIADFFLIGSLFIGMTPVGSGGSRWDSGDLGLGSRTRLDDVTALEEDQKFGSWQAESSMMSYQDEGTLLEQGALEAFGEDELGGVSINGG
jgi:hypothetical protein